MRSENPIKLASQQIKEGPAKEAWRREELKLEIARLKSILRHLNLTEEKAIAECQLANSQEFSVLTAPHPSTWLYTQFRVEEEPTIEERVYKRSA